MPRTPKTPKTPKKPVTPREVHLRKAKKKAEGTLKKYSAPKVPKPKPSPKKKRSTKATDEAKSPKKRTKSKVPAYSSMVLEAIKATHKARVGSSRIKIVRYIEENYPAARKHFVTRALATLVDSGVLKQKKLHFLIVKKPKQKEEKASPKKTPKKRNTKKKDDDDEESGSESESEAPKKKKKTTEKKKRVTKEKSTEKKPRKKATQEKTPTKKRKRTEKEKSEKSPKKRKTRSAKEDSSDSETDSSKPKPKGRGKKDTRAGSKGKKSELVWVWQFLENDKLYYNYDPAASDVVEEVYQNYLKAPGATDVRSVKSGQWNYMVDFRAMTQQNTQHESHTKRKIRRIQVPADEKTDTSKSYE